MRTKSLSSVGFSLILLAGLCVLWGCRRPVPTPFRTPTPTRATPAIGTPTRTPSPTLPASPTPPPTISPSPSPAPTETVVAHRCPAEHQQTALDRLTREGVVLVRRDFIFELVNLRTGAIQPIPGYAPGASNLGALETSPDGSFISYADGEGNEFTRFWVIDGNGVVAGSLPWRDGWLGPDWQSNHSVAFYWKDVPVTGKFGQVDIYDLEQDEIRTVPSSFLDLYDDRIFLSYWLIQYSPDLTWAAYLSNQPTVILWDVIAQAVLLELPDPEYRSLTFPPRWSPTADQVAVSADGVLYLIQRDGEALPISENALDRQRGAVFRFRWSPDGRYLAYWMYRNAEEKFSLLLYNTTNGEVLDTCLLSDLDGYLPAWSPDSQGLAVYTENRVSDAVSEAQDYYVDLGTQAVYPIESDLAPRAWLRTPP